MKFAQGARVEFVGKGSNPIVPAGTRGTVTRSKYGREFLVCWNYPDAVMGTAYTMNWHTSYGGNVKQVDTSEDWYEPSYVR